MFGVSGKQRLKGVCVCVFVSLRADYTVLRATTDRKSTGSQSEGEVCATGKQFCKFVCVCVCLQA